MSSGSADPFEGSSDIGRAIDLLNEAQSILDGFGRPEIGARLQEVIELVETLGSDGE